MKLAEFCLKSVLIHPSSKSEHLKLCTLLDTEECLVALARQLATEKRFSLSQLGSLCGKNLTQCLAW